MTHPELPQNIEAEKATLGSILLNREAIVAVAPWLLAEYFYMDRHAQIYEAMLACYNARIPPDTRQRIQMIATRLGWKPNPLLAEAMSAIRAGQPPAACAVSGRCCSTRCEACFSRRSWRELSCPLFCCRVRGWRGRNTWGPSWCSWRRGITCWCC